MKQALVSGKRRSSLRNLKTAATVRIRSKPPAEGQRYLEHYVLQRDRIRWSQLKERAEQAIQGIDSNLADLGFRRNPTTENDTGRAKTASSTRSSTRAKKTRSA